MDKQIFMEGDRIQIAQHIMFGKRITEIYLRLSAEVNLGAESKRFTHALEYKSKALIEFMESDDDLLLWVVHTATLSGDLRVIQSLLGLYGWACEHGLNNRAWIIAEGFVVAVPQLLCSPRRDRCERAQRILEMVAEEEEVRRPLAEFLRSRGVSPSVVASEMNSFNRKRDSGEEQDMNDMAVMVLNIYVSALASGAPLFIEFMAEIAEYLANNKGHRISFSEAVQSLRYRK